MRSFFKPREALYVRFQAYRSVEKLQKCGCLVFRYVHPCSSELVASKIFPCHAPFANDVRGELHSCCCVFEARMEYRVKTLTQLSRCTSQNGFPIDISQVDSSSIMFPSQFQQLMHGRQILAPRITKRQRRGVLCVSARKYIRLSLQGSGVYRVETRFK